MRWSDLPLDPSRRTLRQFGFLLAVVLAIVGWRLFPGPTWPVAAGAATLAGALALAWPDVLRRLFVGWMVAAFPVGWVMGRLLLALTFFGVFLPLGLVMRASGRDPLGRRRDDRPSYFLSRSPRDAKSYFRQY